MAIRPRKTIGFSAGVLILALGYGVCARTQRPTSGTEVHVPPEPAAQPPGGGRPVLRSGCGAGACHGGPATRALSEEPGPDAWASSAAQWHARDPHVRATEVLTGPLAQRIMDQLRADQPERWAADALDEVRCLACHTNPALAHQMNRFGRAVLRAEGVSCEACHGNASAWLFEHTNWSAGERPDRYAALGMTKLFDVGERAAVCAGCHIGAPADPARNYPLRDMNHDMIAAGHPRLNFDFADYQRRLPPHWYERDRTRDPCGPREPEFEAQAWIVGRVASAEAACRLLADRAARAERDEADWPELSESKCFACHVELRPRDRAPNSGRTRGSTWQTIWPLTRAEHRSALAVARGGTAGDVATELAALERVLARREPRPAETARCATRAAGALCALRCELVGEPDRTTAKTVLGLFAATGAGALDWDESCQVVQGLASLEWMRLRRAPPNRRGANPLFAEIYTGLAFPRPEGRDHFDGPRRFDPIGTKVHLNRLLASVRETCGVRE